MKQHFSVLILTISFLLLLSGCSDKPAFTADNLDAYEMSIPGIQKEYSLLFLTDTHIITEDKNAAEQIKNYINERRPVFISNENNGFVPSLSQWVEYVNTEEYDGLLFGGDILDSPSSSNISYLNSSLKQLKVPYLYTLGNHDWTYPWEYMTEKGERDYLSLLQPYMDNNAYIHSEEFADFTVVAIDNSSNQIHPKVLAEYKSILLKNKPVILLLHVPLYTESVLAKAKEVWNSGIVLGGGIHGGIYPNEVSAEFLNLTTAKDSPVSLVLAGHVHLSDFSNIEGEKNIPQITGDAGYKGKGTLIHIIG